MYVYYIVYKFTDDRAGGTSASEATLPRPITTFAEVSGIAKEIARNMGKPSVLITNWKLLSGPTGEVEI